MNTNRSEENINEFIWMGLALAIDRLQKKGLAVRATSALDGCTPGISRQKPFKPCMFPLRPMQCIRSPTGKLNVISTISC